MPLALRDRLILRAGRPRPRVTDSDRYYCDDDEPPEPGRCDEAVGERRAVRIGLNAQLLSAKRTYRQAGVSRYIEQLLRALPAALGPNDELIVYAERGSEPPTPELLASWRPTRVRAERRPTRILWEQLALPLLARRDRLSLFHGPVAAVPLLARCPTVVTIHDLAFARFPAFYPSGQRHYLTAITGASVRRAARVIAVSESTKADLVDLFNAPPDRIRVIPLAADATLRPVSAQHRQAFRVAQRLPRPYILYVGTLEPRKNVATLLRAFAAIADEVAHDLVLVGAEGWMAEDAMVALGDRRLEGRVRRAGYADRDALACWYGAADLFVYPSRYEGFGLPPLEAMACGLPVITSSISSLPEVVGDAALTVEPTDVAALAAAMRRVLNDRALHEDLSRRGLAHAERFSWARTAREIVDVYREVAE